MRTEEEIGADPQPGDIYQTSWGYDQTNSEFFQVVRRTPGTVTVKRIAAEYNSETQRLYPKLSVFVYDRDVPLEEGKVCRLATKLHKWQDSNEQPRMGARLTINDVRRAWPYTEGGAYDTLAAGGAGH